MPETQEKSNHQTESGMTTQKAQVRDKRAVPEGVVPRQAQGYVIAGLAMIILLAVLFSKNRTRPMAAPPPVGSTTITTDANERKIAELEQNLNAEQKQIQQKAQAEKTGNDASNTVNSSLAQASNSAPAAQPPAAEPRPDPVADAERELAFKSRFTSNLITAANSDSARALGSDDFQSDVNPARPLDLLPHAPAAQIASDNNGNNNGQKKAPEVNINSAHGQPYVLFEGTMIDTVLTNRLDGEFSGPIKVMVSNPAYNQDRQHVLIPEGTFLLGDVQKVSAFGQKRLAVTFHRMIMPDGYSADLDQFHGLDQIGDTGLKDKVNNHYMQIFGASIALGVIAGAAESTTNSGYNESGSDAYRQGVASSLSQSSANVLDRFINIPPAITIREGHRVKVYLTQDMLLPAYENHDMPRVM
jgi:type IV secretion system protein TrbI